MFDSGTRIETEDKTGRDRRLPSKRVGSARARQDLEWRYGKGLQELGADKPNAKQ